MITIEIQPGLWLGNEKSVKNLNFIKTNNIVNLINCNKYLNYSSHKYKSPIREKLEINEIKHTIKFLLKITDFIFTNLKNLNNTLIYCHNNLNISIAVIIAFIMRYGKLSKENTVNLLKSKINSITISNISNVSLNYFEEHLKKNNVIS